MGWLYWKNLPRNSIKFWALSGLFKKQKVPRILKKCKQTRQGPEFDWAPGGHSLGKFWHDYASFQILGTFCCVNKLERAQNFIYFLNTFWVNSGLFTLFFKSWGLLLCKQTRKGPEFDWVPGYFQGKFCQCVKPIKSSEKGIPIHGQQFPSSESIRSISCI